VIYFLYKNEYRIFKPFETTIKKHRKKKNRGDEPIQIIIHIHTWKLCNDDIACIDILNQQKCLFSKTENRKVNRSCMGVGTSGSGEDLRKRM
jgi:hypothetical protein